MRKLRKNTEEIERKKLKGRKTTEEIERKKLKGRN